MSKLIRDSAWSLFSQSGKIITQVSLFILLSRGFGVYEFGLYTSIFSISQLVYNLSGLGTHNAMVMRVSRQPRLLPMYLWTPLIATVSVGSILAIFLSYIITSIYEVSYSCVVFILLTELVAYRLIEVAADAWQSLEDLKSGAILYLITGMCRLILASFLFVSDSMHLKNWAFLNLLLTMAITVCTLLIFYCKNKIYTKKVNFSMKEIRKGLFFSFSNSSQAINANVDKVILSKIGSLNDVGIYSVAYRIIRMTLLPIIAIFQATYPRFFKTGSKGLDATLTFSKKLSLPIIGYGVVSALAIIALSPIIPTILGDQYQTTIRYIQYLAFLPLIQSIQYLLGDAMSGAGFQYVRTTSQILGSIILIVLNLLLVPIYGIKGSILSLLIEELFLIFMYIAFIFYKKSSKKFLIT